MAPTWPLGAQPPAFACVLTTGMPVQVQPVWWHDTGSAALRYIYCTSLRIENDIQWLKMKESSRLEGFGLQTEVEKNLLQRLDVYPEPFTQFPPAVLNELHVYLPLFCLRLWCFFKKIKNWWTPEAEDCMLWPGCLFFWSGNVWRLYDPLYPHLCFFFLFRVLDTIKIIFHVVIYFVKPLYLTEIYQFARHTRDSPPLRLREMWRNTSVGTEWWTKGSEQTENTIRWRLTLV